MVYINVTPENAKLCNLLLNKNKWVVLYHWKQCGHCIELLPKWKSVTENEKNCCIMDIEYDNYPYLKKKFTNVTGFPSIVVYSNGNSIKEFKEQRTTANLKKFIKSPENHNNHQEEMMDILNTINKYNEAKNKSIKKVKENKK
jgi:thioredoxin-like negative regulator of GroEL